jgi:hypothetical protein
MVETTRTGKTASIKATKYKMEIVAFIRDLIVAVVEPWRMVNRWFVIVVLFLAVTLSS